MKTPPIKVECLECGKKFQTRSSLPSCPKCGGVDIDVRTPDGVPNALRPEARS
jgi:Zn finger protein HypA/HybF involved in hydrogenase expression